MSSPSCKRRGSPPEKVSSASTVVFPVDHRPDPTKARASFVAPPAPASSHPVITTTSSMSSGSVPTRRFASSSDATHPERLSFAAGTTRSRITRAPARLCDDCHHRRLVRRWRRHPRLDTAPRDTRRIPPCVLALGLHRATRESGALGESEELSVAPANSRSHQRAGGRDRCPLGLEVQGGIRPVLGLDARTHGAALARVPVCVPRALARHRGGVSLGARSVGRWARTESSAPPNRSASNVTGRGRRRRRSWRDAENKARRWRR